MFHGVLSTTSLGSASTLPRCFSRGNERRLTGGLWLAQAHAYAMALAGVLPGRAATVTRRLSLCSTSCSRTLPSFKFDECADPPRTSCSLTLHPWPPGLSNYLPSPFLGTNTICMTYCLTFSQIVKMNTFPIDKFIVIYYCFK